MEWCVCVFAHTHTREHIRVSLASARCQERTGFETLIGLGIDFAVVRRTMCSRCVCVCARLCNVQDAAPFNVAAFAFDVRFPDKYPFAPPTVSLRVPPLHPPGLPIPIRLPICGCVPVYAACLCILLPKVPALLHTTVRLTGLCCPDSPSSAGHLHHANLSSQCRRQGSYLSPDCRRAKVEARYQDGPSVGIAAQAGS